MAEAALLAVGGTAAAASVVMLRVGWAAPRRSARLNTIGWGLMLLAAILASLHSGAWGITVAALAGMGAALLFLAQAALAAPAAAKPSNRRVNMLPQPGEPLRLRARIVTFLLVAPGAMIVSTALAIPLRRLALLLGASEADALVLALTTVPLVWTVLAYVLLMEVRRRAQWRTLLVPAALGLAGIGWELMA